MSDAKIYKVPSDCGGEIDVLVGENDMHLRAEAHNPEWCEADVYLRLTSMPAVTIAHGLISGARTLFWGPLFSELELESLITSIDASIADLKSLRKRALNVLQHRRKEDPK